MAAPQVVYNKAKEQIQTQHQIVTHLTDVFFSFLSLFILATIGCYQHAYQVSTMPLSAVVLCCLCACLCRVQVLDFCAVQHSVYCQLKSVYLSL